MIEKGNEPSALIKFFSMIKSFFADLWNSIKNLFGGSKPKDTASVEKPQIAAAPLATAPASKAVSSPVITRPAVTILPLGEDTIASILEGEDEFQPVEYIAAIDYILSLKIEEIDEARTQLEDLSNNLKNMSHMTIDFNQTMDDALKLLQECAPFVNKQRSPKL